MADDQEHFSCPMCLELLKDPVTTACGHTYCMSCINTFWDQDNEINAKYCCPLCRQTFTLRPVLKKNTLLAEMVEKLRNTTFKDMTLDFNKAEHGDVECDICAGEKRKAVKSCLVCLVSYCEPHLQPHLELPILRKHRMINAHKKLDEKICPHHDKLLEVYCRTDQQCICFLCAMDEHKDHKTVSAAAERSEKQMQLSETQQKVLLRRLEISVEIQKIREAEDSITNSAWTAVDDFDRACDEHIRVCVRSVERRRSEVKELVRAQQGAAWSQAGSLTERLIKVDCELTKRDREMKQLSQTEDPIHFLRSFQSLGDLPGSQTSSANSVVKCITEQREKLENMVKEETRKMFNSLPLHNDMVTESPHLFPIIEIKSKRDISACYCNVEVDPITVCPCLHLCDENRTISWSDQVMSHPDHPDRFSYYQQALSREGLSGTCYWEVEWSGGVVNVAVSYRSIRRKGWGNDCCFGHNDQSWCLACSSSSCLFWHDKMFKPVPFPCSSRVGVYLNHKAGVLCFYSVSDTGTMRLLHRAQTIFSEPLYPGFSVDQGAMLKICAAKKIN
ncbi:tripartite motif-containing protein 16-like isoform X1 [Osmerus mordax]|uniref:tripartite motif-containing protein 16-like isoform X1 n=1 Tax=Osmerus mordax TaxID=8014 RepID=UPI00350FD704